jgi:transcriptional regulator with XRE-family HTH domain
MASDQGPVIQSALLRNELVRLRKDRELTQEQVAGDLEWSPSKLIRVEGGHSSITKVDLDAMLTEYGVTSETQRDRLQALNRGAREKGWWHGYRDDATAAYLTYVGFETGATAIKQFQIGFVPGLLQTAEYAEAVTAVVPADPETVTSLVQLRLQRQSELLQRSDPPRQYFVLDEGVIRRRVGIKKDRAVMPNQLRAVADRAEQDDLVTVRVTPFEAGEHPGLFDSFTILEFEEKLPDALVLDADRGEFNMMTDDEPQVEQYQQDFDDLLGDALSATESIELMRRVAAEMS